MMVKIAAKQPRLVNRSTPLSLSWTTIDHKLNNRRLSNQMSFYWIVEDVLAHRTLWTLHKHITIFFRNFELLLTRKTSNYNRAV